MCVCVSPTQLLDFSQQLCARLEQLVLTYASYNFLSLVESEPDRYTHIHLYIVWTYTHSHTQHPSHVSPTLTRGSHFVTTPPHVLQYLPLLHRLLSDRQSETLHIPVLPADPLPGRDSYWPVQTHALERGEALQGEGGRERSERHRKDRWRLGARGRISKRVSRHHRVVSTAVSPSEYSRHHRVVSTAVTTE